MTTCEDWSRVSSISSPWTVRLMLMMPVSTRSIRSESSFRGTEDDVATVVRYAAEHQIPVHARGAGSDTGGGALGNGIVIDFSQHLRKIVKIAADRVVVEPGVVLETLNAELAPLGRRLEPVPVNARIGTVGGMISVDAAGVRSLRFGSMGDQVEQLRVVMAQGDIADLGFRPWPAYDEEPKSFTDLIVRKLQNVYRQSRKRMEKLMPPMPRNRAGYLLGRASSDEGVNLARLVSGSEGTLALILQAVLRTVPLPAAQGVVVLPFRPSGGCGHRRPALPGTGSGALGLRSIRLAAAQPGTRCRSRVPCLDRRGGRVGSHRRVRERSP